MDRIGGSVRGEREMRDALARIAFDEREREITLDPAQLNGDRAWNSRLRQPGGPP